MGEFSSFEYPFQYFSILFQLDLSCRCMRTTGTSMALFFYEGTKTRLYVHSANV
jgi:hypothetical protein